MKKVALVLVLCFSILTASYASTKKFNEFYDLIEYEGTKVVINVEDFEYKDDEAVRLTEAEILEMYNKGMTEIDINMPLLTLKIKTKELIYKGDIAIFSDYVDEFYGITIYSSKIGKITKFDSKVEAIIPYDIDHDTYYVTAYSVDNDGNIINLRGTMDENNRTVSVLLDSIELPFIPVINKVVYEDVHENTAWAEEFIADTSSKGLIAGKREGVYAPESYVTRAEFATLLLKALDLPLVDVNNNFSDVKADQWYYKYVTSADYYGLTAGVYETEFMPNAYITREDMVIMLAKALDSYTDLKIVDTGVGFTDEYEINDETIPYARKCLHAGLINGYHDGTFRPETFASRAEAAVIISKLFGIINVF
ncbi:MAG: S-layer homology domain-containing protein [Clostridia bacterium]|nr:S-layer homology domain-containing protein [Clostridia bacterium]